MRVELISLGPIHIGTLSSIGSEVRFSFCVCVLRDGTPKAERERYYFTTRKSFEKWLRGLKVNRKIVRDR